MSDPIGTGKPRVERRLAAILALDVAGYSRLVGEDEEGTVASFRAHRRELIDPAISTHRGRIVNTTGDGMLVEFASAVDAVRCAIALQSGMAARNASVPPKRRIDFRAGINVGDVMVDGDDLLGDGVNVAARLEAIAEPGGICLSEEAFHHVQGKVEARFVDLGEPPLKNIARPVRVYRVEIGAKERPALALPDKTSIAVLPFQNMSGDPEQEYFCHGMVEDIITGLARIKSLFVIARNSSFSYKGRSVDVKQVGRELGVRYVLEGSVRKAGNRVRITGQLVDAATGAHVWAERYERPYDDIFALQDEITLAVVGAIEPNLRMAEIERVKRKRPENLSAYDLVLRSYPLLNSGMPEDAARALPLLERAVALEPEYGLAHGCLACCHQTLFMRGGMSEERRLAAVKCAHAAVKFGPDDPASLATAGFVLGMIGQDLSAARDAFETAASLSPSYIMTYTAGGVVLGWAGDAERAIEWGERALRLSPFDPTIYMAWMAIFDGHFLRGRYGDAVHAARKAIQSNFGFSGGHSALAAALAKTGKVDEARAAVARALALDPSLTIGRITAVYGMSAALAAPLAEAMRAAGVPE